MLVIYNPGALLYEKYSYNNDNYHKNFKSESDISNKNSPISISQQSDDVISNGDNSLRNINYHNQVNPSNLSSDSITSSNSNVSHQSNSVNSTIDLDLPSFGDKPINTLLNSSATNDNPTPAIKHDKNKLIDSVSISSSVLSNPNFENNNNSHISEYSNNNADNRAIQEKVEILANTKYSKRMKTYSKRRNIFKDDEVIVIEEKNDISLSNIDDTEEDDSNISMDNSSKDSISSIQSKTIILNQKAKKEQNKFKLKEINEYEKSTVNPSCDLSNRNNEYKNNSVNMKNKPGINGEIVIIDEDDSNPPLVNNININDSILDPLDVNSDDIKMNDNEFSKDTGYKGKEILGELLKENVVTSPKSSDINSLNKRKFSNKEDKSIIISSTESSPMLKEYLKDEDKSDDKITIISDKKMEIEKSNQRKNLIDDKKEIIENENDIENFDTSFYNIEKEDSVFYDSDHSKENTSMAIERENESNVTNAISIESSSSTTNSNSPKTLSSNLNSFQKNIYYNHKKSDSTVDILDILTKDNSAQKLLEKASSFNYKTTTFKDKFKNKIVDVNNDTMIEDEMNNDDDDDEVEKEIKSLATLPSSTNDSSTIYLPNLSSPKKNSSVLNSPFSPKYCKSKTNSESSTLPSSDLPSSNLPSSNNIDRLPSSHNTNHLPSSSTDHLPSSNNTNNIPSFSNITNLPSPTQNICKNENSHSDSTYEKTRHIKLFTSSSSSQVIDVTESSYKTKNNNLIETEKNTENEEQFCKDSPDQQYNNHDISASDHQNKQNYSNKNANNSHSSKSNNRSNSDHKLYKIIFNTPIPYSSLVNTQNETSSSHSVSNEPTLNFERPSDEDHVDDSLLQK